MATLHKRIPVEEWEATPEIKNQPEPSVQLDIPLSKLEQLFEQGGLCAAEFRCMNKQSKLLIQALCLNHCKKRLSEL
ncbi:hypothetical protein CS022_17600 [Veronia nyctiphanis]|uniref:Uncharacterized protein n=1 Tax=Veronia nyctiphanis TaxID=1278244 RepID=A0A4Q0YMK9_9GAMM|nr:hypothetical protein [Veronia nyctiphanis]RXJ72090.1 hypothetical protein CS022_17600 [Veronia nyctiphanis]